MNARASSLSPSEARMRSSVPSAKLVRNFSGHSSFLPIPHIRYVDNGRTVTHIRFRSKRSEAMTDFPGVCAWCGAPVHRKPRNAATQLCCSRSCASSLGNQVRHGALGTPADRLRARSVVEPVTGCWVWQEWRNAQGYGRISHGGRATMAHRLSYEVFVGPVARDQHVLHRCDNPPCINPDHLFLGTNTDNMQDMIAKGRRVYGNARLSPDQVAAIRASTGSQSEIARAFGVGLTTVHNIINGKSWRPPPPPAEGEAKAATQASQSPGMPSKTSSQLGGEG